MTPETQLFGVFHHVPLGMALSLIALVLIASFFITSADSLHLCWVCKQHLVLLNLLVRESNMGCFSIINRIHLITSRWGNGVDALNAIQSAAIISAFPFSFVVIMMMISFYKDANQERKFLGLTLQPNKHRLQDYVKYQQQDYESDILEKRESRRNAKNNMKAS